MLLLKYYSSIIKYWMLLLVQKENYLNKKNITKQRSLQATLTDTNLTRQFSFERWLGSIIEQLSCLKEAQQALIKLEMLPNLD